MSDNSQLFKKENNGYKEVYPLSYIQNIIDAETKEKLPDILIRYNHIYVPWQDNITDTRLSVPKLMRRKGLWISYDKEGTLYTEYFKLSTLDAMIDSYWESDDNWETIPNLEFVRNEASKLPDGIITPEKLSPALQELIKQNNNITNLPDDEDLEEKCGVIKFKDRDYNPYISSGKGYKILRKNWVRGYNTLTQNMINKENTIYEIRYDFDLKGQEIIIPEGCVLKFEGGSFKNGTIKNNRTMVICEGSVRNCLIDIILPEGINIIQDGITVTSSKVGFIAGLKTDIVGQYNYNILKALLVNKCNIIFDEEYYINISTTLDIDYHLEMSNGSLIFNGTSPFKFVDGGSIKVENMKLYTDVDYYRFIYTIDFTTIVDHIIFKNNEINNMSICQLTFADIDNIGVNVVEIRNNNINLNTKDYENVIISNAKFFNPVYIVNNIVNNSTHTFIYIGATNEDTYAAKKARESQPIYCIDNTYIGNHISKNDDGSFGSSGYHCAFLVESDTLICQGNTIKNVFSTNEGGTAYDIYGSCRNLYFENNVVENILKFRLNGVAGDEAFYTHCELGKSKETNDNINKCKKVFRGNTYKLDVDFVKSIGATQTDLQVWIFAYTFLYNNVDIVFENNIIDYPIEIRGNSSSRYANSFIFRNNQVYCKKWSNYIWVLNGVNGITDYVSIANNAIIMDEPTIRFVPLSQGNSITKHKYIEVINNISNAPINFGGSDAINCEKLIFKNNIYKGASLNMGMNHYYHFSTPIPQLDYIYNELNIPTISLGAEESIISCIKGRGNNIINIEKIQDPGKSIIIRHLPNNKFVFNIHYETDSEIVDREFILDYINNKGYSIADGKIYELEDGIYFYRSNTGYLKLNFGENYNSLSLIFKETIAPKNIKYSFNIIDSINPTINITFNKGTTTNRPSNDFLSTFNQYIGFKYFDTTLGKPVFWNGTSWVDANGILADVLREGNFSQKPNAAPVGFAYFCTDKQTTEGSTNGIMIYHKGNNVWVDAFGRVIS